MENVGQRESVCFPKPLPEIWARGKRSWPSPARTRVLAWLSEPRPWETERPFQCKVWEEENKALLNTLRKFFSILNLAGGFGGFLVIEFLCSVQPDDITFHISRRQSLKRRVGKYLRKAKVTCSLKCPCSSGGRWPAGEWWQPS